MENKNNILGSHVEEQILNLHSWFDAKALEGGVLSHSNDG